MMDLLSTLLYFFIVILVLIAVHEFGHFWVARRCGVKVLRYSIGFGKTLWRRVGKADQIEYVLAAVPLGGYVQMLDEREGEVCEAERHRAFNRQSIAVRSAIVAAGPAANFLLAILLFWVVLVTGDVGVRAVVAEVKPGSLAEQAGFVAGDELLAVAGREGETWETFVQGVLEHAGERGDISVAVRDARGDEGIRRLPTSDLLGLLEEADPLGQMGLTRGPLLPPRIGAVVEGEPAAMAGMRVGDRVVAVEGQPMTSWRAFTEYVRAHPGERVLVSVEREAESLMLPVTLGRRASEAGDIGRIGAGVEVPEGLFERYRVVVRMGPLDALGAAVEKTWSMSLLMLEMMGRMVTGEASVEKNLGSVISIARAAGQTAEYGVAPFLKFLAQISIVLAVMNLLPVPMLDGGHLAFFLIEAIRGRPLSPEVQERAHQVGLALLLALIGLALYLDVIRLLG